MANLIGTSLDQVPVNGMLGRAAFLDSDVPFYGAIKAQQTAPTIASAGIIAPTTLISFVSGAVAINTITPPTNILVTGGQLTLIPTGLWTTSLTGNIAYAVTAVLGVAVTFIYDSSTTKWYPSVMPGINAIANTINVNTPLTYNNVTNVLSTDGTLVLKDVTSGNISVGGTISSSAKLSINDLTTASSNPLAGSALNITQTWSTLGVPTAIKLNVTDNQSNAYSLLMDLQVGGVSKFSVAKTGSIVIPPGSLPFDAVGGALYSGTRKLIESSGNSTTIWDYNVTDLPAIMLFGGNVIFKTTSAITWGSMTAATFDLALYRDAANTLAQRNSTNAQTFRLYNTYTSVSDYSRLTLTTNANNHQIVSEAAGAGALKPICEKFYSSASAPTTTNIPDGFSCMWKNTTDSTLKLYANDGGTLKSTLLV